MRIARISVDDTLEDLASQQQSVGGWAAVAAELAHPTHDPGWFDRIAGVWLYTMFAHQRVYVLDEANHPVYANVVGHQVRNGDFSEVAHDIMPLVRLVRTEPVTPWPVLDVAHLRGIAQVMHHPMAVSVMIIEVPPAAGMTRPRRYVMIDMKLLDESYLSEMFHRYSLNGVRFSDPDDVRPGERVLVLRDPLGYPVGHIMWRPELPGRRILATMVPIMLALSGVLLALVGLLLQSFWRITLAQFRSVEALRESEAHARRLSEHDALTGLANRVLFDRRLYALASSQSACAHAAILMIDLDRFKQINDTLGHHAGDCLLREFAVRLRMAFRTTDMVARLGGDEFAIVADLPGGPAEAESVCERVFAAMRAPFQISGREIRVGISVGMAVGPEPGRTCQDLHRRADIALYQAKADGRNCRRAFSADLERRIDRRNLLEEELRHALFSGIGLFVVFQPQVRAGDSRIVGLEALVRWRRAGGEVVMPEEFVAVAEEVGLIRDLGAFVLGEALAAAARRPGLFMSVNLSPLQLREAGFARAICQIVRAAGVSPGQIEFEITEGVLLENDGPTLSELDHLRQQGFRIALDDFGVGYSSLSYLRRLRVDKIKIDRSFIETITFDAEAMAIVGCIVALGRTIGVTVTAEGVETEDQRRLLAASGCDELQGYLFSRPVAEIMLDSVLLDLSAEAGGELVPVRAIIT